MPLINAVLYEVKNKSFPEGCFLNVDVPTDVSHVKVFKFRITYRIYFYLFIAPQIVTFHFKH